MAGATGLEPATSGVTGRRSNQLSYAPTMTRSVAFAVGPEIRDPPGQVKVAHFAGGGDPPRRRRRPGTGAANAHFAREIPDPGPKIYKKPGKTAVFCRYLPRFAIKDRL